MNKPPKKSRYLNPKPFGEIINHRLINYPKESEEKIILYLKKANSGISLKELEAALKETKECVSRLAGSFSPKEVSDEEVGKLAQELFNNLKTSLTDKQKKKLRILIIELLRQNPAFGEEINTRYKKAAKKAIKIACKIGRSSSIEETKSKLSLTNKTSDIEKFFLKNIVVGVYKDPLTIKRTESSQRFKRLYEKIQSLENELSFFLQQSSHRDTIQLKKEFQHFFNSNKPPNITLQTVDNSICRLKIICSKLINDPGRPGRKNPAIFETVNDLASIWKKYTGKEPTLINYADYRNGSTHSPFLDYLKKSIESIIPLQEQENTKKQKVSLSNIAKEVISFRKSMAKTPSK